jgi:hypothetical protein
LCNRLNVSINRSSSVFFSESLVSVMGAKSDSNKSKRVAKVYASRSTLTDMHFIAIGLMATTWTVLAYPTNRPLQQLPSPLLSLYLLDLYDLFRLGRHVYTIPIKKAPA